MRWLVIVEGGERVRYGSGHTVSEALDGAREAWKRDVGGTPERWLAFQLGRNYGRGAFRGWAATERTIREKRGARLNRERERRKLLERLNDGTS